MITDEFKNRITSMDVAMSQFQDKHGIWAKEMELCVNVYVQFADGYAVNLTPDDYKGLPVDQQAKIRHARSSPAVP